MYTLINVCEYKLDEFKSILLIANFTTASNINTLGNYLISKQLLLSEHNQKPLQPYGTKEVFISPDLWGHFSK